MCSIGTSASELAIRSCASVLAEIQSGGLYDFAERACVRPGLRHRAQLIGAGGPSNGADDSFTMGTYRVGRRRLAAGRQRQTGQ